jgi:hypothetical protein
MMLIALRVASVAHGMTTLLAQWTRLVAHGVTFVAQIDSDNSCSGGRGGVEVSSVA